MRVVFLDIDGPMIPSTFVLFDRMAAWDRKFPVSTIAVMARLCERSGARIVVNSTHNQPRPDAPDIIDALIAHGLSRDYFHPTDPLTRCHEIDRNDAVREWLAAHGDVTDWVAFDDSVFTQDDELIWVDSDSGLTLNHLNQALERFGCKPILIFV